jgi:hypothetical protein
MSGNLILSVQTNDWTLGEIGRWSLDINRGATNYIIAFDTGTITNSTVLDTGGINISLFFRKWPGELVHRVRQ